MIEKLALCAIVCSLVFVSQLEEETQTTGLLRCGVAGTKSNEIEMSRLRRSSDGSPNVLGEVFPSSYPEETLYHHVCGLSTMLSPSLRIYLECCRSGK